jgi:3-methyladenine DNA glycosylase Mpg
MCSDANFAFSRGPGDRSINTSLRIGISRAMELPWRFYAAGNPHVSRTSPKEGRAGVEPARL